MRVERKCLICNQKYYSPDQDQLHEHGGEGRKSEHGGVEVASPSHIDPEEKKIKIAEEVSEISTVDKSVPKKNKKSTAKIPKKVDKRSREYRQSIGR